MRLYHGHFNQSSKASKSPLGAHLNQCLSSQNRPSILKHLQNLKLLLIIFRHHFNCESYDFVQSMCVSIKFVLYKRSKIKFIVKRSVTIVKRRRRNNIYSNPLKTKSEFSKLNSSKGKLWNNFRHKYECY